MVLIDTNILVYLLVNGDRTKAAHALFARDPDWRSEDFLLIEFSNVIATFVRMKLLTRMQGNALLGGATKRMTGLIALPHSQALDTATEFGISAYDARFIGLAKQLGAKLVTEDTKLRAAVPTWTRSLAQAIA